MHTPDSNAFLVEQLSKELRALQESHRQLKVAVEATMTGMHSFAQANNNHADGIANLQTETEQLIGAFSRLDPTMPPEAGSPLGPTPHRIATQSVQVTPKDGVSGLLQH